MEDFAFLGPKGWLTGTDALPYQRDWLNRYGTAPIGVARPVSTAEVARVIALARAHGLAVVPQGGNTGLCGAAVTEGRALILSLNRMAAIGAVDLDGGAVEVEAGLVLADLHARLEGSGLVFPLHLGAEGSARIGGLIATNAGGSQAFRHGTMADLVLGLQVVLPDGTIWDGRRAVQKDNAGYALRRLFAGSEGTLGVITRAVLRLAPAPRDEATALLALPDAEALVAFGRHLRATAGEFLAAAEFLSDQGLDWVLKHLALDWPLDSRAPFYLLVALSTTSAQVALDDIFAEALETGMAQGLVLDGAIAASLAQRAAFWRLREEQPEGQRLEGVQIKHDISVPVARIPDFLAQGAALCAAHQAGIRINPFGHLGDGNIHYNISPPEGAGFAGDIGQLSLHLCALAQDMGGSFAAEHGLGRSKVALADRLRSPVERRLMAGIKAALDPEALFNPGVILRDAKEKLS
ncbi:FAD-binding oxidoreductase [Tabrizicola sp.]|uniref:FAD-binding oxidoreductase n=1 Tax=Tabrizicola sp. TaxID=2005166 RepID=UPI001A4BCF39|nr:FAD-binding oxidoreductase [Tabrizicola sp.]MBL9075463.1 FAD-binding oxidoreductase [Tabrizicola sp.]